MLFFAGVSTKFDSMRVQQALLSVAVLALLADVGLLLRPRSRSSRLSEQISADVAQEVSVRWSGGVDFTTTDAVAAASRAAGFDEGTTDALVESYAAAQLLALTAGRLARWGWRPERWSSPVHLSIVATAARADAVVVAS